MKIAYAQLDKHLKAKLAPTYLVAGDEPLLVGEALARIRKAARDRDFLERTLHVVDRSFRWAELVSGADELSLFASRQIVEVRMGSPRPGEQGGKAIRQLAENPSSDRVVVIGITAKLDASASKSAWVKSVTQHGVLVDVRAVTQSDLPKFISVRAERAGIELTRSAAQLLAERVEGNLLAADQEIKKLALTASGRMIDDEDVLEAVANSARFDVFRLTDAIIAGDAGRALHILAGLREEGTAPALVAWAVIREITLLARLASAAERGVAGGQAMREAGVWQSRQELVRRALRRFDRGDLSVLLHKAADVDAIVKGSRHGGPWEALTELVISSLRPRLLSPAATA